MLTKASWISSSVFLIPDKGLLPCIIGRDQGCNPAENTKRGRRRPNPLYVLLPLCGLVWRCKLHLTAGPVSTYEKSEGKPQFRPAPGQMAQAYQRDWLFWNQDVTLWEEQLKGWYCAAAIVISFNAPRLHRNAKLTISTMPRLTFNVNSNVGANYFI